MFNDNTTHEKGQELQSISASGEMPVMPKTNANLRYSDTNQSSNASSALERARAQLCSGFGQYHTTKNGDTLPTITLSSIFDMVANPQNVDKSAAMWFIPSTARTRVGATQKAIGEYHAIWVDIDQHTTMERVLAVLAMLETAYAVHSSKSSTVACQKWRVIMPLVEPLPFAEWTILTEVINDTFEAAGITPDRATQRANQLCFLPNQGEFYDYRISSESPKNLVNLFASEIAKKHDIAKAATIEKTAQKQVSFEKAAKRITDNGLSPIDALIAEYPIEQALANYGYTRQGNKFLSPNSTSGVAGVTVKGDKWFSNHSSDIGIGKVSPTGKAWGDVFDLFVHYEYGGNADAAMNWNADITHKNQVAYMKASAPEITDAQSAAIDGLLATLPATKKLTFNQFTVTSDLDSMKSKMLNDVFVLDGIALMGQLTTVYAKPNTGKTLLTLWMLVDSIKAGRIKGENVHYINADDTYKGLITKAEVAKKYGFGMIAPNERGFKVADFNDLLQQTIANDTANGVIIVLDTLKKFTDLMDKKRGSQFMKLAREFTLKGGTMIMLAHTNKNRTADGKVVAGGTSDITDDCDCAYTLDEVQSTAKQKDVIFENFKARGNNKKELLASYATSNISNYFELLLSVNIETDLAVLSEVKSTATELKDLPVIEAIIDAISQGVVNRTAIIKFVMLEKTFHRNVVENVLDNYVNFKWTVRDGAKNSKIYNLA
jgi:archaellum biogenesis ATPase FlaH